jgi:hypothetical protein
VGFVTHKVDVDLRFIGNYSLDAPVADADKVTQSGLFANSAYAFSRGPTVLMLSPKAEFWMTPSMGLSAEYNYSLVGKYSPHFYTIAFGAIYRFSKTSKQRPRTFQEVDISTDQEAGKFQGEGQDEKISKKVKDGLPIIQEEEAFE